MRRVAIVIACILLALLGAMVASANVRIVKIVYDPPTVEMSTTENLNKERVKITNFGSHQRNLRGWKLRDRQGHVYVFGLFALGGGHSLIVHTGSGNNKYVTEPQHAYWGRDNYVWNDGGDRAKLTNRVGRFVDSCSYAGGAASVEC